MMPIVMATTVETAATESTLATLSTVPRAGAPDRPAKAMLEITDAAHRTSPIAVETYSAGVVRSFRISMLMSRLIAAPRSSGRCRDPRTAGWWIAGRPLTTGR